MKKKMILQRLWYLLCWIALMQLGFVNAYASEVVRKNYKIGIAPSHVTTSPNSFLKNTSEWAFVAKQIDFYNYYPEFRIGVYLIYLHRSNPRC